MLKKFIAKVAEGRDLSETEAAQAMGHIMEGEGLPTQIASLLTALRMKKETVPEITGFARTMRGRAVSVRAGKGTCVVDTCGTGGDGLGTFNISTAVSLVAAGAGLTVAKHGNRSVSSRSGSADVLEALGLDLALPPRETEACLQENGFAFLFAPAFHPAMKHAVGPRREIGLRTVFNLLGPLTNPAGATVHLVGVYDRSWTRPIAEVLKGLGSKAAFVVHGEDHADEISITGRTSISELRNGTIRDYHIEPETCGLNRAPLDSIRGGAAGENAQIINRILDGEEGPPRDVVLLNAAAVFVASGKAADLKEGVEIARESIDSGKAKRKLAELVRFSRKRRQEGC